MNMDDKAPTIDQWKELYTAAIKFQKKECWNWMWDTDLFGVQNPENGDIGYCCVMGKAGEHFALGVYLGSEGLRGYLKMRSKKGYPTLEEVLKYQNLLMASFEGKEYLFKEDLQIIKEIGLKFDKYQPWPLFRNYRPEYYPWFLTASEAKYLTLCLYQAIEIANRFKKNPKMLTPPKRNKNHYLVRVPKKEETGFSWRDLWLEPLPLPLPKDELAINPIDKEMLRQIEGEYFSHQGTWEIEFFSYPNAVQDEEGDGRPFFPYLFLWVEHYSGFVLHSQFIKPDQCVMEFQKQLFHLIRNMRSMPEEILVKKEETFRIIEPIAKALQINLQKVNTLPMFNSAKRSMSRFFKK